MPTFRQTEKIADYSAVAITTANQKQTEKTIKPHGDLVALGVNVSVTITKGTGTIDTAAEFWKVINKILVQDKNSNTLYEWAGTDLQYINKLLEQKLGAFKGRHLAASLLTDVGTAQVQNIVIPVYVNIDDQPATITLTFGVLSDLLSVVGTGAAVATVSFIAYYRPPTRFPSGPRAGAAIQPSIKTRIYNVTGMIVGDNSIAEQLPKSTQIFDSAIKVTEANLASITFKSGSESEYETLEKASAIALDVEETFSGHLSTLFHLRHTPYVKNDKTTLIVNEGAGPSDLRLYHIIEG